MRNNFRLSKRELGSLPWPMHSHLQVFGQSCRQISLHTLPQRWRHLFIVFLNVPISFLIVCVDHAVRSWPCACKFHLRMACGFQYNFILWTDTHYNSRSIWFFPVQSERLGPFVDCFPSFCVAHTSLLKQWVGLTFPEYHQYKSCWSLGVYAVTTASRILALDLLLGLTAVCAFTGMCINFLYWNNSTL